jgi:hypothetical protein
LIVDINLKLVALRSVEIKRQREKFQWIPPYLPGLPEQGKRPRRVSHWGVLVQIPFRTAAAGDSHTKESIRSYIFVDYGKIDADHSSCDSLRDSGEEQSKVVKL